MSSLSNRLTLLEAAQILGVSAQTVRRLVQKEKLAASQFEGPHGLRWEIERRELLRYMEHNGEGPQPPHEPPQPLREGVEDLEAVWSAESPASSGLEGSVGVHTTLRGFTPRGEVVEELTQGVVVEDEAPVEVNTTTPPTGSEPPHTRWKGVEVQEGSNPADERLRSRVGVNTGESVPLHAHLAALALAERQLNLAQSQLQEERVRREQAQERVAQEERLRLATEFQLQKYQMALAEQSESLTEERALKLAAEARLQSLEQVEVPEAPALELRVAMPPRRGWAQRLRSWLGGGSAQAQ